MLKSRGDPESSTIRCFDSRSLIRLPISVEYSRGVMIMPFWLYGGAQMSDFTENYRFSPNKLIQPIMIML